MKSERRPYVQMEPAFCPVHNTPGPCLYCLAPDVYSIVMASGSKGSFFIIADHREN